MNSSEVFITANPTPNPDCLKFIVDRQLVEGDPLYYRDSEAAHGSPLAEKLFELEGVREIFAFQNFITVTKRDERPWQDFARQIGKLIRSHIQAEPLPYFQGRVDESDGDQDEAVAVINRVLDEIRPNVARDGGNIVFAGYRDGVVQVFLQGSCSGCPSSTITLKAGIEDRLRLELPELKEVVAIG